MSQRDLVDGFQGLSIGKKPRQARQRNKSPNTPNSPVIEEKIEEASKTSELVSSGEVSLDNYEKEYEAAPVCSISFTKFIQNFTNRSNTKQ